MAAVYDKHYYETYAALTLSRCFGVPFGAIHFGERPDLQMPRLDTGVEVTQALTSYDGQFASYIGKVFGRPYSFEAIQSALERVADLGLPNDLDWAAFAPGKTWHPLDMNRHYGLIQSRIVHKLHKLNSGYALFGQNDLYVFAHTRVINPNRLLGLLLSLEDRRFSLSFDRIFINCIDRIYSYNSGVYQLDEQPVGPGDLRAIETMALAHTETRSIVGIAD